VRPLERSRPREHGDSPLSRLLEPATTNDRARPLERPQLARHHVTP
jgi:hypothetical protein